MEADHRAHDIYIAAGDTIDAASGDTVVVRLKRRRAGDPGPRGAIVEIVQRETHQFVGTYFESAGASYVAVDGNVFSQPIYVGDPGAKNANPDDKVVFEMVRFPSQVHDGEGVITEVLGPRGKPGVDTLSIIREFNLPDEFADDALEEAREQAEEFDESIGPGRTDLTEQTVLTIDPVDARDFDDAISLEVLENGHWRLGVHIADVAHFVQPKTPLDREARERGTSVYLPDRVIPMLPEVVSNSLASLQPNKVRYTKSALIEFTADGARVATDFCSAAIKSNKRLTYEQVDEFLADPQPWRRKLGVKVHELLGRMHALAMILRRRRFQRGALELSMPEVKVDLDRQGRVVGAHVVENTESHQIIEEFMLAANEAVAERLHDKELPFLRRIHEAPDDRKLEALTQFARELGIEAENIRSRFDLQRLLAEVEGRPEQHAVNYALLRSLQRAVYSPAAEEHYALASQCYCHFTSPIRRYPDLTVHRLLGELLEGKTPRQHFADLVVLGEHCSDRERRAEAAERELTKMKLLTYLSERIGEEMEAVVTGVQSFGLFAQGTQLPAEGLIHVESLQDDYYHYDRATHVLEGRRSGNTFRLGDLLEVVVARVDLERRELDFRLVRRKQRGGEGERSSGRGRRKGAAGPKKGRGAKKKKMRKKEAKTRKGKRKKRR
jgi:ribonuclease R